MNLLNNDLTRTSPSVASHEPLYDLLRAAAAQAVLIGHMYALLVDNNVPQDMMWKLLRILGTKSHEAVIVFFLLSGVLVGTRILDRLATGSFDVFDYGLRRFARLYSVIVPGLLFTAVCVWLVFVMQDGLLVVNQNRPWFPVWFSSEHSNSLEAFACNLVGLQMIRCYQYGHNSSLWSLSNEAIYYALFPALLIAGIRKFSPVKRGVSCVVAVGLIAAIVVSPTSNDPMRAWFYASGFAIWCLGAVASRLIVCVRQLSAYKFAAVTTLAIAGAFLLFKVQFGPIRDIGVALWLLIFIGFCRTPILMPVLNRMTGTPVVKAFSDYSYSLYFIHVPALLVVIAWMPSGVLESNLKLSQSGTNLAVFISIAFIINVCSFCFARQFESRSVSLYRFSRALLASKLHFSGKRDLT